MVRYVIDEIQALLSLDWVALILGIFILMSGIIAIVTIIGKFSEIIGRPVKWVREKRKDHELIIENAKAIQELSKRHEEDTKQSIRHDEMIRNDLSKLTRLFVEKQIDDMRFEILDFASAISLGRNYSKEQFDHVISIDKKYQKILEENDMENGQVTASMEVIMEVYKEKLRTGF